MKKIAFLLIIFLAVAMMANTQTQTPQIPDDGVWYNPKYGDGTWRISQQYYGTGAFFDTLRKINHLAVKKGPNSNWVYHDVKLGVPIFIPNLHSTVPDLKPTPKFVTPTPIKNSLSWWEKRTGYELLLGFAVVCLLILIIVITSKLISSQENWLHSIDVNLLLKKENESLRNKLPIEAPAVVDSSWLAQNNPVGNPIPHNPDVRVIKKAFGQYPHLVVQAKVSTHPKSTEMGFSHERKAITALDGVLAYLGWNWNKETRTWDEVGYVAGPCANGFVFTPEAIERGMTFSKIELFDKSKNPVIMTDTKADTNKYPKIIWPLIQKYHRLNIVELKMSGMAVFAPKPKKAPAKEKPSETNLN